MKANLLARFSQLWSTIAGLTDNKFYGFRNGAIVEQPYYESAPTTWVAGGELTFTHNLGVIPKNVQLEAITTAVVGSIPIGTRFILQRHATGNVYYDAQVTSLTSTALTTRSGTSYARINSTTGADAFTPANSQLIVKAWA